MTSLFPGALDNFAESSPSYMSDPDSTGRDHSERHDDVESALEAIQGFVGARKGAGAVPGQVYWDETVGRRCFAWDTINNRWQMVYGDTGWRDVTGILNSGWSGGQVLIRRAGELVTMQGYGLTGAPGYFFTLPAGFRPKLNIAAPNHTNSTAAPTSQLLVWSNGSCEAVSDAGIVINASWVTEETWPVSLPGSASGPIPSALPFTAPPVPAAPDADPDIPTGLPA